jgi:hypothetical protein
MEQTNNDSITYLKQSLILKEKKDFENMEKCLIKATALNNSEAMFELFSYYLKNNLDKSMLLCDITYDNPMIQKELKSKMILKLIKKLGDEIKNNNQSDNEDENDEDENDEDDEDENDEDENYDDGEYDEDEEKYEDNDIDSDSDSDFSWNSNDNSNSSNDSDSDGDSDIDNDSNDENKYIKYVESYIKKYIELNDVIEPYVLNKFGDVYYYSDNLMEKSLEYYMKAYNMEPKNFMVLYNIGKYYEHKDNNKLMVKYLELCINECEKVKANNGYLADAINTLINYYNDNNVIDKFVSLCELGIKHGSQKSCLNLCDYYLFVKNNTKFMETIISGLERGYPKILKYAIDYLKKNNKSMEEIQFLFKFIEHNKIIGKNNKKIFLKLILEYNIFPKEKLFGNSILNEIKECKICLDEKNMNVKLLCNHSLCFECLKNISKHNGNIKCPFCRSKVIKK